ncbi:hypothetical protein CEE37_06595 [candidate division LCP-89 bacterium B3_LCP]|uniref:DUF4242 domain-containing protein n=1 Tax=candidate division LCP-89 bacterium B3_LCP TaxID=2012998 RepID=A0A532V0C9_UNCL8|nr:MAG: hypothetical protein CEE37_06595 [candidate division LCP-89 bacterium B3_LCP]
MERAYVDKESGKVACCWIADSRQQVTELFNKAGVAVDSIAQVDEALEGDFI